MKKLYTFALASFVAITAAAVRPVQPTDELALPAKATFEFNFDGMKAVKAPAPASKIKKAHSRAEEATLADYMITYDWAYVNLLRGSEDAGELTFTLVDEATGKIKISGFPQDFEVEATIDLEKNTVSIPNNQLVGRDSDGPIYFYGKQVVIEDNEDDPEDSSIRMEDGAISDEYLVGTIEDFTITFDVLVAWALGDPAQEKLGWWLLSCANELTKGLTWYNIGEGKIMENITYPIATKKENTSYTSVTIQACVEYEDIFRVLDPLKATYSFLKINSTSPAMILDASIPDDVLIGYADSGLSTSDLGELYYTNWALFYMMEETSTPEEYACTMTVKGNKHTITCPAETILIIPETPISEDQLMYTQSYPTVITFEYDAAGIDNVVVEDTNAPVEYFNLQGIRVANPENGIFIRRQGNNATKVRF